MNQQPYQFKELGATEMKQTNVARQSGANTVSLVSAPAGTGPGTTAIVVYQIDFDTNSSQVIVGDNNAVDGTDRIFANYSGTKNGTVVFPGGVTCRVGKALTAIYSGDGWVRVSYMQI